MSETKQTDEAGQVAWTPGPWEWYVSLGDRGRIKGKELFRSLGNTQLRRAIISPNWIEFNGEGVWEAWITVTPADARLIAAAPEMYEALEQCMAQLDSVVADLAALTEIGIALRSTNAIRGTQITTLAGLSSANCAKVALQAFAAIAKAKGAQ
jgi:hypothetical protein